MFKVPRKQQHKNTFYINSIKKFRSYLTENTINSSLKIITVSGQTMDFLDVKADGAYIIGGYHCDFKS
jgi:hypothetical protein